jgi:hypothetical protein
MAGSRLNVVLAVAGGILMPTTAKQIQPNLERFFGANRGERVLGSAFAVRSPLPRRGEGSKIPASTFPT